MKSSAGKQKSTGVEDKVIKPDSEKEAKADQPVTQWQFHPDDSTDNTLNTNKTGRKNIEPVTWTASEFIAHQKSVKWYLLLGLADLALAALIYLITRDKITTGVIIFAAFIFGFYAARKPRVLEYRLDDTGLAIGHKSYAYGIFKSFKLVEEGAFMGIILMPLKRFMPSISLYFEPKDEKKITSMLAERLPVEEHKPDIVDKFMRQIRF